MNNKRTENNLYLNSNTLHSSRWQLTIIQPWAPEGIGKEKRLRLAPTWKWGKDFLCRDCFTVKNKTNKAVSGQIWWIFIFCSHYYRSKAKQ